MMINYSIDALKRTLMDFYCITGISMSICDTKLNIIAKCPDRERKFCSFIQCHGGEELCTKSDAILLKKCMESKKAEIHICHAGLTDMLVPIEKDGVILGYILMGRAKSKNNFKEISCLLPQMKNYFTELETYYNELPLYDEDKAKKAANLAVMLTKYIWLEKMIKTKETFLTEEILHYIDNKLPERITVNSICETMHISKNVLYRIFREDMNCTVNEYIINRRIEKAEKLLSDTTLSINEISKQVGIDDCAYFCRLFKKITGITPLRYRKIKM